VEPHSAGLSLLVATIANSVRLVGRQESGMVQAFFSRILSRGRNHRALFYLGAAPAATHRRWVTGFSAVGNRADRQLLLFQSADDRVVLIAD
jgi:hypothetical protein